VSSAPDPLCAECRSRPVDARYKPFCSARCKALDLARWADGGYRVPGAPVDPESIPGPDDPSQS
jgi:endogenous inhibitor of DNA gyrase (YacG/DUF329 family)